MRKEFSQLKITTILTLFILMSCNNPVPEMGPVCKLPDQSLENYKMAGGEVDPDNPDAEPEECNVPEREKEANLVVSAQLHDFNPEQEAKMLQALERLEIVINSQEFKKRVLEHQYQGEYTFVDNEGLSNEEIYNKIMEGAETFDPVVDEELDLDITLYYRNNSTVGYTYPNTHKIWVNNKFFAGFTLGKVAANAMHEWTHKIGFGHDFKKTARRSYSVPYAVGTIVKELVDGM